MSPDNFTRYILDCKNLHEQYIMTRVLYGLYLMYYNKRVYLDEIRWLSEQSLVVTLSFIQSIKFYKFGCSCEHCGDFVTQSKLKLDEIIEKGKAFD